ncbi:endonuclease domain-containing protein [Streptomyces sp. NPDC087440]|uniref:endonuclease domain-containing protein n=1 Tax=Streptomyces sp. NPDC087440 TaxID=3365790 RepID=UPI0037F2F080
MVRGHGVPTVDDDSCKVCDRIIGLDGAGSRSKVCEECYPAYRQYRAKGLTVPQVNAILRVQNDRCPICDENPGDDAHFGRSWWHIDHDHACQLCTAGCRACVRGMLCAPCNSFLVARYENLDEDRRTWPVMNDYLANPPARSADARRIRPLEDTGFIRARNNGPSITFNLVSERLDQSSARPINPVERKGP